MNSCVALLRGINVSGHKSIKMADLQRSCEALGWSDVVTYLQSGNVVFRSPATAPLAAELKQQIARDFAYDVEVLILTASELARIVEANPFFPTLGTEENLFHATFLWGDIDNNAFASLALPAQPDERCILVERTVLLYCPGGYGKTKLHNAYFEKALNIKATTRNWRTVLALYRLCQGSDLVD